MTADVECPYCGEGVEINHDDGYGYTEDEQHQQECDKCGKTFVYYTSIHIVCIPHKADCLNGASHNYKRTNTFPHEFSRLRCVDCGHETSLPAKDGLPQETHP